MTHLPGTPHVMKCALMWTYGATGMVCENVFYLQDGTDAIFAAPGTVATNIYNAAVAHLTPVNYPEISINGVALEDVRTTVFGATVFPQTPSVGTNAGGGVAIPSNVSLSIKKVTGNPGRSGRGRWYWPIASSAALINGDTVGSAYAAGVVSGLGAFQTAVEGSVPASQMGIVSYFQNKVLRPSGLFQRITAWVASDLNVDDQRRRLLGRGR